MLCFKASNKEEKQLTDSVKSGQTTSQLSATIKIPHKYNLPILGMRKRVLELNPFSSQSQMRALCQDYHLAILKASIRALDCNVLEIASEPKPFDLRAPEYAYVRDPAVILHDKNLVISTQGNKFYCSDEIINKVKEINGYKHKLIKNAYFEGGNMFYVPSKKLLLHGLDPDGHYLNKEDTRRTDRELGKVLHPYGIRILGLSLNPNILDSETHYNYYYHLDCFMQLLPDGRLIILNKNLLSVSSQKKLEKYFRNKLIDLNYTEYLNEPVIFNFLAIPKDDSFTLISPTLPESVAKSLMDLNFSLVTPEIFDTTSPKYNKAFAAKVAAILESEGHVGVNETNLATHLSLNVNGYKTCDGHIYKPNSDDKEQSKLLDRYYRKKRISFVYGGGGPHCFTTEIVPSKRIKSNNFAFFKPSDAHSVQDTSDCNTTMKVNASHVFTA